MGKLEGHKTVSVYVEGDLWRLATAVAHKTDRPIYQVVGDALRVEVNKHATPEEQEALLAFFVGDRSDGVQSTQAENHVDQSKRSNGASHASKGTRVRRKSVRHDQ